MVLPRAPSFTGGDDGFFERNLISHFFDHLVFYLNPLKTFYHQIVTVFMTVA